MTAYYQLRRVLIALGLTLGPASFLYGSFQLGRLPEGAEWFETVLIVPLISVVAGGAIAGLFGALELIHRRLTAVEDS